MSTMKTVMLGDRDKMRKVMSTMTAIMKTLASINEDEIDAEEK